MRDYALFQAQFRARTYAMPRLHRWIANWRARRGLARLEEADDHLLDDIGVTREDVVSALRLPLDCDPVAEIYRRAGRR